MQAAGLELRLSVESIDAVLFLEDVGQLGVAVPKHAGILEQHSAQACEPLVELLDGLGPLTVPPRVFAFGDVRVPPDPTELADEERLPPVGDRILERWAKGSNTLIDERGAARGIRMARPKLFDILSVVVRVVDIGFRYAPKLSGAAGVR